MLNQPITSSPHWRVPVRRDASRAGQRVWRATLIRMGEVSWLRSRWLCRGLVMGALVGSVLGAPLLALAALVCLFAPSLTGGRRLAPALIVAALLWLVAAIVGAHANVRPRSDERDPFSPLP